MSTKDRMPRDAARPGTAVMDDERPTQNRTGVAIAPECAEAMTEATAEFLPSSDGDAQGIARMRIEYAAPSPLVHEPGAASLLMDKLGERLAFERAGARLYEALLSKLEAYGPFDGGPSADDLRKVLGEERRHFDLLRDAIDARGGDPTELTPSANLQLVASAGVGQVLTDPAVNLIQSLEAVTLAELADNECWETLVGLARLAGDDDLAGRCEEAFVTEQEHLDKVRAWLAAGQGRLHTEGDGAMEEIEGGDAAKARAGGGQRTSARTGRKRARRGKRS
jgi:hypothetical protein